MRKPAHSIETLMETFEPPLFLVMKEKVLYMNHAGQLLTGYSPSELLSLKIDVFLSHDDLEKFNSPDIRRQLVRGLAVKREVRIRHKSGTERWSELAIRRLFWENSRGLLCSFPEISVHNEALSASSQSGHEMEKLNKRMQEDFAVRKKIETRLRESLNAAKEALHKTVQALSMVSEQRDPYTAGHQKRVSKLACAIARKAGLPEKTVEGIGYAGILHDIGKLQLPFEILNKPGQLSDLEMKLIQTHPRAGYEILKNIPFERPVAQIVLQHHERLNGSGYPQGLNQDEILLESRILAIADVVEAIASHRPYRPALGINAALETIKNNPALYDAGLTNTCLSLFQEDRFQFDA